MEDMFHMVRRMVVIKMITLALSTPHLINTSYMQNDKAV